MSRPTITVAIPAYNASASIVACVRSALAALDEAKVSGEVIVCDDASTDTTTDLVRSLMTQDSRVHLIPHAVNLGRAENVGFALESGTGEWVALLPADCTVPPSSVRDRLNLAGAADLVFGHVDHVDLEGQVVARHRPFDGGWVERAPLSVRRFLPVNPAYMSATIIRRSAYQKAGGFRLHVSFSHRDWDLLLRVASIGPVAYVPTVVSLEGFRSENATEALRRSDRIARTEADIVLAFDEWCREQRKDDLVEVAEWGRRRWARRQLVRSIALRAGVRPGDPDAAVDLAAQVWPSSHRSAVGLLARIAGRFPLLVRNGLSKRIMEAVAPPPKGPQSR